MRIAIGLRRAGATLTFLLLTLVLAELAAGLVLGYWQGRLPSRSEILATLDPAAQPVAEQRLPNEDSPPDWLRQHVLHPYLGFVRNPDLSRQIFNSRVVEVPLNEHGFFGPSPLEPRDPNGLTIVIPAVRWPPTST